MILRTQIADKGMRTCYELACRRSGYRRFQTQKICDKHMGNRYKPAYHWSRHCACKSRIEKKIMREWAMNLHVTGTDTVDVGRSRFACHSTINRRESTVNILVICTSTADCAVQGIFVEHRVIDIRWKSGVGRCFRIFMLWIFTPLNGMGDLGGGHSCEILR